MIRYTNPAGHYMTIYGTTAHASGATIRQVMSGYR